jgi:glycoside/pentoside/hexuronide:cation symporter, GPH family
MKPIDHTPQRPPLSTLLIYAAGQLGWSLASYAVGSLLTYFYMPPEAYDAKAIFPNFIPTTTFMGLTLLGIIAFGGRLFDAIIDPYVANLSDKYNTRFGKRRFFMALAALPLAVLSYLIFQPVTEGVSSGNVLWLGVMVFGYYVSFATYVIPYTALISELGHVPQDRLTISTLISVAWALGFLIGNTTPALQGYFERGGTPSVAAFQKAVGIFATVSFIFMMIPVVFLNEKKYAQQEPSYMPFRASLQSVLSNRAFRYFAGAYLLYWLALSFIQSGIIYYVTVLLGMDKSAATLFGVVSFFASFGFYPFMAYLVKRFGKRPIVLAGFLTFCGIFCLVLLPLSADFRFWAVSILSAFPLAVFGVLPNTIVADIIHTDEQQNQHNQAGMFYAGQAFMMKVGISLANLIFPSLLVFGRSIENPTGIQLSVLVALIFCLCGYFIFRLYKGES